MSDTEGSREPRSGQVFAIDRVGVIAGIYGVHLGLALAFAWPVAKLLSDKTLAHPRGDLLLFEPGALFFVEAVRLARESLTSVAEGLSFGVLLAAYLGLLPLGALLYALSRTGRATSPVLASAALRLFGPLSLLLGMALVMGATLGALPLVVESILDSKLRAALGDRAYDVTVFAFRAAAAVAFGVVGVVHDLARAALVSRELPALGAAERGLDTFRRAPARCIAGFALRGALGWLGVLLVALATARLDLASTAGFFAVTILHQLAAFALVFLRAAWLADAIRLTRQTS